MHIPELSSPASIAYAKQREALDFTKVKALPAPGFLSSTQAHIGLSKTSSSWTEEKLPETHIQNALKLPEIMESQFKKFVSIYYGSLSEGRFSGDAMLLGALWSRGDDHAKALHSLGYRVLKFDDGLVGMFPPDTLGEILTALHDKINLHQEEGKISKKNPPRIGILYFDSSTNDFEVWIPQEDSLNSGKITRESLSVPKEIPQERWHHFFEQNILPISLEFLDHELGHASLVVNFPEAFCQIFQSYREVGIKENDNKVSYGMFDNRIFYQGEYSCVPARNKSTEMLYNLCKDYSLKTRDDLTNFFCMFTDEELKSAAEFVINLEDEIFIGLGGLSRSFGPLIKGFTLESVLERQTHIEDNGPRVFLPSIAVAYEILFNEDQVEEFVKVEAPRIKGRGRNSGYERGELEMFTTIGLSSPKEFIIDSLAGLYAAVYAGYENDMTPESFIKGIYSPDFKDIDGGPSNAMRYLSAFDRLVPMKIDGYPSLTPPQDMLSFCSFKY